MSLRWGIVGCGDVTEVKSGPALQQARGSSLAAVMRRDGRKAQDYARRHGVPRWYDDADALIHDPGVDAVYVATPPSTHAQYAIAAMRAGKPVYVEKPMALDAGECEAMLEASRATGMPLFVAYYRRALPRFLKVRELLAAGAIGTPRRVRVVLHRPLDPRYTDGAALPWRVRPEVAGGGLFVDLGSHALDLLDFLFGPIVDVSGRAASVSGAYPAEDTVAMAFAFDGGVRGEGDWCFCSDARRDEVEISGDRGLLRFATFDEVPVELEGADGTQRFDIANPQHIQLPLVETLVAELRGEGRCPSTGMSGARTTRIIDAVLEGYRRRDPPAGGQWLSRSRQPED
ncbi:Gfo/Idh/MocA family oxidoreductase [Luteimonas marina]|uniref:Gfo/Idh/MocA family oxidoreductase n=1 Tax=Luteimonas marina TaxID=488485 RepID=A0A5C5U151_9GAMM|nr:Gfo/Idh/MocA family oxidoreductase [Luteimonas marina]TWT20173.1 Gfo/Idh/MocA family oxidoreductase [Luteimonas marina]